MTGAAFVLGRPPTPGSVLHAVVAGLRAAGVPATVDVVAGPPLPDRVLRADLRVLKDLEPPALRALVDASTGACVPAPHAVLRSLDKAVVTGRLAAAGVPVPATRVVDRWDAVRAAADCGPVVVKPRTGSQGEGVLLLAGPAPQAPAGRGPWLVQDRVAGDGVDRKLYVAGDVVRGVLRTWPPPPADRPGEPFDPDPDLAALARRAAEAVELAIAGVDALVSAEGPVVVDVNAFPGFKGVPGAAQVLTSRLLRMLDAREVATCA